ncbi:MAG TPA: ATP synthase F1 subunit gamma [Polyangiales bacterium]|jgi:F-type H+-transporting ATPase subunit gamma|nr:ATP synthase F1 subunit gamma [Polyangiales bacterium]
MAALKDIRKRISSVKSTQKITRAMKLVAGARLRKAQQNIERLRPYAVKTYEVLSGVAARVGGDEEVHPLLARREPKSVMLVVLTSDRGLAGAFNSNICKAAYRRWKQLEAEGSDVCFGIIGRKGRDYFRRRGANIRHDFLGVFEDLNSDKAGEIGRYIVEDYTSLNLDACYLVYNEFKSAISQQVVIEPFLPIEPMALPEDQLGDFIYEPNQQALLDNLLPMYVEVEIYRALLESVASEHGARMTAMDAATNNASDMIDRLTLQYNRARQAAITKELMEIIGGAEALKG